MARRAAGKASAVVWPMAHARRTASVLDDSLNRHLLAATIEPRCCCCADDGRLSNVVGHGGLCGGRVALGVGNGILVVAGEGDGERKARAPGDLSAGVAAA